MIGKHSYLSLRWAALLLMTIACRDASPADLKTAELNAENALKLARNQRYGEAYTEIGWLLDDPQPFIRQKASDVLAAAPQIATWRLSQITSRKIISTACETPTADPKGAIKDAYDLIVKLAAFAPTSILPVARSEVEAAEITLSSRDWIAECSAATAPISEDERHRIAESIKVAAEETQREADKVAKEEAETARKAALVQLREYDRLEFCNAYGNAIRDDVHYPFSSVPTYRQLFEAEAVRRKISLNRAVIKAETMRIGMDQCTLYASWGTPRRQNRSVGPWGVHLQLIYGDYGPYVYLRNGIVTSYQD